MLTLSDMLKARREMAYSKVDDTLAAKSTEIVNAINVGKVIDTMNDMLGMTMASAIAERMANVSHD